MAEADLEGRVLRVRRVRMGRAQLAVGGDGLLVVAVLLEADADAEERLVRVLRFRERRQILAEGLHALLAAVEVVERARLRVHRQVDAAAQLRLAAEHLDQLREHRQRRLVVAGGEPRHPRLEQRLRRIVRQLLGPRRPAQHRGRRQHPAKKTSQPSHASDYPLPALPRQARNAPRPLPAGAQAARPRSRNQSTGHPSCPLPPCVFPDKHS